MTWNRLKWFTHQTTVSSSKTLKRESLEWILSFTLKRSNITDVTSWWNCLKPEVYIFLWQQLKFRWGSMFLFFEGFQPQDVLILLFSVKYWYLLTWQITHYVSNWGCFIIKWEHIEYFHAILEEYNKGVVRGGKRG